MDQTRSRDCLQGRSDARPRWPNPIPSNPLTGPSVTEWLRRSVALVADAAADGRARRPEPAKVQLHPKRETICSLPFSARWPLLTPPSQLLLLLFVNQSNKRRQKHGIITRFSFVIYSAQSINFQRDIKFSRPFLSQYQQFFYIKKHVTCRYFGRGIRVLSFTIYKQKSEACN